jgi:prevent-host-death family protein
VIVWSSLTKGAKMASTVNMLEAKTHLSRLVERIETGEEREIIIARNGRPVAKLTTLDAGEAKTKLRLGLLEGKFPPMTLEEFDRDNDLVRRLFEGEAE